MPTCECCLREDAVPVYRRGYFGQVVRGELGAKPDAAYCDDCWRAIGHTLRRVWIRHGRTDIALKFENDCAED